jgi:hypothetical protein
LTSSKIERQSEILCVLDGILIAEVLSLYGSSVGGWIIYALQGAAVINLRLLWLFAGVKHRIWSGSAIHSMESTALMREKFAFLHGLVSAESHFLATLLFVLTVCFFAVFVSVRELMSVVYAG